MRLIKFFEIYFKNFSKLILVNLLFAIPLVVAVVLCVYLSTLIQGMVSAFVFLLPIILLAPFVAGVTLVSRDIIRGNESISVFKLFFKGIKENTLKFFSHSAILYVATLACYFAIRLYWNLSRESGFFYVLLGLVVIIAIAFLFGAYYVPIMTVSVELSLKDIYKNCFLFSFGEIKNNFFATLGLLLILLIGATFYITLPWLLLVFIVLIVPSTVSMMVNFYIYDDMMNLFMSKTQKANEIENKINGQYNRNKVILDEEKLDFSMLDLDENKDGDEYLYFNGKMLKRRVLIEMKKQQESSNE